MKIGQYELGTPVFLAPMAGVTDKAFRETVVSVGGKYVWTEMISDKALTYKNPRTLSMLNLEGEPEPRIVQLFGSEPETMAEAAKLAVERGADIIDINMGCPTPKIVKNGEGASLLLDLPRAQRIARAVVKAVKIPVIAKTRLGWDEDNLVVLEMAQRLEESGIQAITIHGRTRAQFYSGRANWDWIGKVKQQLRIPVIGNGDVTSPERALKLIQTSHCDGVMIGRAALGNPWLIASVQKYLDLGTIEIEPSPLQRLTTASEHFDRLLRYKGERIGVNEMRKHAVWYIKGLRGSAQLRDRIMQTKNPEEMRNVFMRILSE
ncbi:MAG: tRNA dihydrouridine synthase DusB [Desulfitobacterium hafniense]|nr:tRNA dihydrouridine synthase DusB [Desulfitobacterium hafniense]